MERTENTVEDTLSSLRNLNNKLDPICELNKEINNLERLRDIKK